MKEILNCVEELGSATISEITYWLTQNFRKANIGLTVSRVKWFVYRLYIQGYLTRKLVKYSRHRNKIYAYEINTLRWE